MGDTSAVSCAIFRSFFFWNTHCWGKKVTRKFVVNKFTSNFVKFLRCVLLAEVQRIRQLFFCKPWYYSERSSAAIVSYLPSLAHLYRRGSTKVISRLHHWLWSQLPVVGKSSLQMWAHFTFDCRGPYTLRNVSWLLSFKTISDLVFTCPRHRRQLAHGDNVRTIPVVAWSFLRWTCRGSSVHNFWSFCSLSNIPKAPVILNI